jgi:hypothetical protein
MNVTIYLHGRCPVCGYRNRGIQVGTAQPRMNGLRLQPGSIGFCPHACDECGHPLDYGLYDRGALDAESTAKLKAWRQRERTRRGNRKRRAA